MDALIASIITAMGATAVFSLLPVIHRSSEMGENQTKAVQITSRLVEHIQLLRPGDVNAATLTQLNLIDPNQNASPYRFNNIPLDDGSRYSPARVLPQGTGTMTVTQLADRSIRVVVTVSWRENGHTKSHSSGTVLGGYR